MLLLPLWAPLVQNEVTDIFTTAGPVRRTGLDQTDASTGR
jgi:hypothetical protein